MPARDSIQLLTIGNSFANNSTEYLAEMARAAGKELVIFRANVSGKSFAFHARRMAIALADPDNPRGRPYENESRVLGLDASSVSLPEALAARAWDFVTIHQYSLFSHQPETYEPYAGQIIAAIRSLAPRAEILVHQTWAFREDCPLYKNGFTQQTMYEELRAAYAGLAERNGGLRVIPSGEALQAARATPRWTYRQDPDFDFQNPPPGKLPRQYGSLNVGWRWIDSKKHPGRKLFNLDYKHANGAGKYLTGCVWFEMLYGMDCENTGAFTPPGLKPEDTAHLRHIAHRVVLSDEVRKSEDQANP